MWLVFTSQKSQAYYILCHMHKIWSYHAVSHHTIIDRDYLFQIMHKVGTDLEEDVMFRRTDKINEMLILRKTGCL